MTAKYTIREADDSDIPAILHIYNARPITPQSQQVSLENRKQWLQNAREMGFPVIVASTVATGELVVYASLGFFFFFFLCYVYCLWRRCSLYETSLCIYAAKGP